MADLATDLTAGQLTDFRENWLRDKYVASPYVALSEYNKSRKENFVSDTQIQAIYDRLRNEASEEFEEVKQEKLDERLAEGDDDATAETVGDLTREEAVFRLLRVACRNAMAGDPGFRASVSVGGKNAMTELIAEWKRQSNLDVAWVRARAGRFNLIEIERG